MLRVELSGGLVFVKSSHHRLSFGAVIVAGGGGFGPELSAVETRNKDNQL
jgi:hypothetical protein